MDTQIILNINKEILEKATEYAKRREISLSILIENYLQKILDDAAKEINMKTSIVNALSGIASKEKTNQDDNVDFTEEHLNYLMKKYK